MNEMKDLKNVLDRIEGKLIAADRMYSALNFAVWGCVMLLYYILIGLLGLTPVLSLLYWVAGFTFAMLATFRVWKRLEKLWVSSGKKSEKKIGIFIGLSWGLGALLGWGFIPYLNLGVNAEASMAMGFLSFIAIAIFGMWLTFTVFSSGDYEIIPSFALPALATVAVLGMPSGSMVLAGFVVAFSFMVTISLYLYSAFRAIEG